MAKAKTKQQLTAENEELRARLQEIGVSEWIQDADVAEKLSRRILEQAQEGIAVCIDGCIVRANKALYEICGCMPLMQPFDDVLPLSFPDSETFSAALPESGKTIRNQEVRYERPDGRIYNLILNAGPLAGKDNRLIGALISLLDITERKRAENQLRESEQRARERAEELAALLDTIPTAVIITHDPACNHMTGNRAANELLRLPSGGEISLTAPLERRPHHYKAVKEGRELRLDELPVRRSAKGENVQGFEYTLVFDDGTTRELAAYGTPLRDGQGNIRGALHTLVDITERKRAEEALLNSNEMLSAVTKNSTDAIYVKDRQSRWLLANPALLRIVRKSKEDVLGRTDEEIYVDPAIGRAILENDRRIFERGIPESFEEIAETPDGLQVFLSTKAPRFNEQGQIVGLIGISRNITESKKAEKALRKSEARFRLLSDTAATLLAAGNPQGVINELCRKVMEHLDCQAFFNFMVDEKAGRLRLNACAGIPEEEIHKLEWLDYGVAVCGCVARDGTRIIAEDIFHTPDARTALVKSYGIQAYCCHPLRAQNRLTGTLSFGAKTRPGFTADEVDLMRTVADQVAIALQRVQDQKLLEIRVRERTAELTFLLDEIEKSRDDLRRLASELVMAEEAERKKIAVALHDEVAQTLAAAKMRLDLLKTTGDPGKALQAVEEARELLAQSIRETRSLMTEISSPVLYDMGLVPAIRAVAEQTSTDHGIPVTAEFHGKLESLQTGLSVTIYQVVKELLQNVIKHSLARSASVRIEREADTIRAMVVDDGRGFDADDLGFPKGEGGFGLFSIRERVRSLGGDCQIASAPGKGTAVTVTLPAQTHRAGNSRRKSEAPLKGNRKRKP